jgi:hypothetical protein
LLRHGSPRLPGAPFRMVAMSSCSRQER